MRGSVATPGAAPAPWTAAAPASLAVGFVGGMLLLAIVPSVLWPSCRDLLGVADGGTVAAVFARKVEASALASAGGMLAVVGLACVVRPGLPLRPLCAAAALRASGLALPSWGLLLALYLGALQLFGSAIAAQEPLRYAAQAPAASPWFWLVAAIVGLLTPIAEELVFRGFLQPLLQAPFGRVASLAMTSLLFGLGHGLPYALPLTVLGAFFGWLAMRHGSLLPAMLAHALFNAVTFAAVAIWPPLFDLMYPSPR